MYQIRQYDNIADEETYKEIKKTKDRYAAKVAMLQLADKEVNSAWILWQQDGEDWIRLQTIQNTF